MKRKLETLEKNLGIETSVAQSIPRSETMAHSPVVSLSQKTCTHCGAGLQYLSLETIDKYQMNLTHRFNVRCHRCGERMMLFIPERATTETGGKKHPTRISGAQTRNKIQQVVAQHRTKRKYERRA
jgi:ribosomal protein S27AE